MVFESLLDPIFRPLLKLSILWTIIIISLIIALIITFVYKYTTNQDLMKRLKNEMKEFQKEIKELRSNPAKAMEVQKKAMQTNMKYMMHSMRSTLFTFIPIIVIFSWMSANIAFEPVKPNVEFTTTVFFEPKTSGTIELIVPEEININGEAKKEIEDDKAIWLLKGREGEYPLDYKLNDEPEYQRNVLITNEQKYAEPIKKFKGRKIKQITIDNKKMKILNLFGWKIGWLGSYIIFSIIFSMILRKIIKVY